jgi:uncharacterized membrane protein YoaK (UPF0700 family)
MFKHKGNARTFRHNFRLAAFLCFAAGLVNICGVLGLGVLTTNVTGHFAYFAEGVLKKDDFFGAFFLLYIVAFLAGSFVSSFLTEYFISKDNPRPHTLSIAIEILILLIIGLRGNILIDYGFDKRILASFLLFVMGLQNSLVSKISNSTVRTTHLTGLFTDLGIELSQLLFYKEPQQRKKLLHSIGLRLGIISFFFAGCIAGGFLFLHFYLRTLLVATFILALAMLYDRLLLKFYKVKKNIRHKINPESHL